MANTTADLGQVGMMPQLGGAAVPVSPDINSFSDRMFARGAGEAGEVAARSFGDLSTRLGAMADQSAAYEGRQQGLVAGLSANYQPNADESIRGRQFNEAATTTYLNQVSLASKQQANQAYDTYMALPADQRNPAQLQQQLASIHQDFIDNHLAPEMQGQFNDQFGALTQSYLQGAQRDLEARTLDASKATTLGNLQATSDTAHRIAAQGLDATTPAVQAQMAQYGATIDAAVNAGTMTEAQGVVQKHAFAQSLAATSAKARFDALPDAQKPAFATLFAGQGAPGTSAIQAAILGQESGTNPAIGNSRNGAVGIGQVMPSTFAEYARPGESITNPADNEAVSHRIVADYAQRYGGDPARVAVAYFSGPGNVAPPGSATPWLRDTHDANNKYVSSYVSDVLGRLGLASSLDPETHGQVQAYMATRLRQLGAVNNAATRGALGEIAAAQTQVVNGVDVPDAQWQRLTQKYATATNPVVQQAFNTANNVRALISGFRAQNPAEIEATLTALEGQYRQGGTPQQGAVLKAGQSYLGNLQHDLATDPLARGVRDGVVAQLTPLNPADPRALQQGLVARASQAAAVAQHYAIAPRYLMSNERSAFKTIALQGGPQMVATAAAINAGLGAQAGAFYKEIGGDAPNLALMGKVAAMGGDQGFLNDLAERARLNNDPATRGAIQSAAPGVLNDRLRGVFGTALADMPQFQAEASRAARQVYELRSFQAGEKSDGSGDGLTQAAQEAVGAHFSGGVQYGGVTRYGGYFGAPSQNVLLPANVRADHFADVVGAITDHDLAAMATPPVAADGKTPLPARLLQHAYLTAIDDGKYVVSMQPPASRDPQFWRTAEGGKFVLDLGAMAQTLRQRVPQAYAGAQVQP
ncbi:MAG: transglycosylase SLT domain-containing protein [Hyphomicrobiales bacterium]|nr:transglycosylase SLT domain-containing protein [Hyphomicrobiales bacterium]